MDQTGQQRHPKIAAKQPPTPPELADPPGRKVRGVYICRALRCGVSSVSYDENPPAKCRSPKCSGEYVEEAAWGRWLKCRDDAGAAPPAPAEALREPARAESETRVSDPEVPAVSAADYRAEWVGERVAALCDGGNIAFTTGVAEVVSMAWDVAEALYDEGRRRGHLP